MLRLRREPRPFRRVESTAREWLTPWMVRITFAGPELRGLIVDEPAASIRLLIPTGSQELVVPTWNGNEFLLPDGTRPVIRTFTPPLLDDAGEIALDFVIHGRGPASEWAGADHPGLAAALSGPGRGYTIDAGANHYVLAGDETAIPAIRQLVDAMPQGCAVEAHVAIAHSDARIATARIEWHEEPLEEVVAGVTMDEATRVWVAGEAATVQRVRKDLFDRRQIPRAHATVRGYWKHGRAGDDPE